MKVIFLNALQKFLKYSGTILELDIGKYYLSKEN